MNRRFSTTFAVMLLSVFVLTACAYAYQATFRPPPEPTAKSNGTVIINITTGPDDVFRLLTAFHVAEDALASGRKVVLFFNGRGVTVPVKRLSTELQLGRERTLWVVLRDLVTKGAEVLVARESVRTLNMADAEFIAETQFGAWGGDVFCKFDGNTVVFSY